MSTRDALIQEILKQPEPLLRELQQYLSVLLERQRSTPGGQGTWPDKYFEDTAGAFADEPFERPPQLLFENRESW